jgi:hypothetical protein
MQMGELGALIVDIGSAIEHDEGINPEMNQNAKVLSFHFSSQTANGQLSMIHH